MWGGKEGGVGSRRGGWNLPHLDFRFAAFRSAPSRFPLPSLGLQAPTGDHLLLEAFLPSESPHLSSSPTPCPAPPVLASPPQ